MFGRSLSRIADSHFRADKLLDYIRSARQAERPLGKQKWPARRGAGLHGGVPC
jgi:hypothetical protein